MATLSTLGQMMLSLDPGIKPYSEAELTANRIQGGRTNNATALLQLEDLKRQQEAQAAYYHAIQQDPSLVLGGAGGGPPQSILSGLQPPRPDAITQSPMPGMSGQAQTVPPYPDASRYARVSPQGGGPIPPDVAAQGTPTVTPPGGPPQSILGALGPQPRPDPVRALLQQNPQAGLQLLDMQAKRQEQQFKMRGTVAEGIAVELQGATDQASYAAALQRVAQISPQWAQALPQVYSKEAVQPWIDRALSAKDKAQLDVTQMQTQVEAVKAQADLARARMSGRVATTDEYLKALGVAPGTETPQDMQRALELKNKHQAEIEAGKVNPQIIPGPGGEYWAVNPRTLEQRPVGGGGGPGGGAGGGAGSAGTGEQLRAPMTADDKKLAAYASRMEEGQKQLAALESSGDYTTWKAPVSKLPGGRFLLSEKQKQYENAKGIFLMGLLRRDSAGQITETEWKDYGDIYFPTTDDPPQVVAQKAKFRAHAIQTEQSVLGRPLPGQASGTQAPPTSQGTPKPVGEMSREDIAAEIAAIKKRGGS